MTFLNWIMLAGLAAVAVPILIHLLNRSRARVVDWGAMRFLEASLASRSRRILLEEIILLVLRCLIMAMAALALARPFLPTRPTMMVLLFIPAVVAAAICAALAAAMWAAKAVRRWLLLATVALLAVPIVAAALEQAYQKTRWSFGGGEKDVAIVVDGSLSMTIRQDGNTNFGRALDEARSVVASCSAADGVSLIVAGASPRAVLSSPTSNRRDILTALSDLQPIGGSMRVVQSLQMASQSLLDGANPAKKIVLITDGQHVGWDVRNEARWKLLGGALRQHPTLPQVIVRTLPAPTKLANAAIADVTLDRKVIGTDRDVHVDVRIAATGTEPIASRVVKLLVDGEEAGSDQVDKVLPNAAETVHFKYRFDRPGRHVVAAKLLGEDDLPGDDTAERVVDVLTELRVLVVDGRPSTRPLDGAADFIDIALAPPAKDGAAGNRPRDDYATSLVVTKVVPAPDIATVGDLAPYGVVVLADVPLLPKDFAERLAAFVRDGGGLLIAPGAAAQASFYNAWTDRAGQPVTPCKLLKLRSVGEKPARLLPNTFSHPALAKVADQDRSDARLAQVSSYWQVEAPEDDRNVAVAASLDTGEPLLAERRLGEGYVILTTAALDVRSTNLPALKCFVPLVHELTYYLASPAMLECNVESGTDVTVELGRSGGAGGGTGLKGEYFGDKDFRQRKLSRVDRRIDFNWGGAKPAGPDLPAENFAVRWTGRIEAPRTGTYTFHATSDDGARLWVAGRQIINDWTEHAPTERTGQVKLTAGRKADLKLEYFNGTGEGSIRLEWSGPGIGRQVVPTDRLSCDGPAPAANLAKGDKIEVITPSGGKAQAVVADVGKTVRIGFTEPYQPGLYRMVLPKGLAEQYAQMSPDGKGVPFAVVDSGNESTMALLTDADLLTAREHLLAAMPDADPGKTLVQVESTGELTAAVAGGIPGRELWQLIAIVLVAALLAEIALTRWIAVQRKAHSIRPVSFGADAVDAKAFRRHAREMLTTATPELQGAGKD